MKAVSLIALLIGLPVAAHETANGRSDDHVHDRVIQRASELVPWCKSEAEAHFIGKGETPYQWTASYHDRGNVLHVEGKLRIDGADVAVQCRIARGAREHYASIDFQDPRP